jgi:glycosyl-4,4'-diaponeurosporenoate acyltransferase
MALAASLPSWLPAVLGCATLWLGWSLLVGMLANRLPARYLEGVQPPGREPPQAGGPRHETGRPANRALRHFETRLAIRRWKPWIPDAGDALPGGVRKASLVGRDPRALRRLLLETRRAELVHWALWPVWMVTCLWLPPAGVLINLAFATLFNLPCLLLQRYTRLRLQLILQRLDRLQRLEGG